MRLHAWNNMLNVNNVYNVVFRLRNARVVHAFAKSLIYWFSSSDNTFSLPRYLSFSLSLRRFRCHIHSFINSLLLVVILLNWSNNCSQISMICCGQWVGSIYLPSIKLIKCQFLFNSLLATYVFSSCGY